MRRRDSPYTDLRLALWKRRAANPVQRRLFRVFVESGGDLSDAAAVETLIRYIEATVSILPPKLRMALEGAWRQARSNPYRVLAATLSRSEGLVISLGAVRQRVSRGARFLEQAIRTRRWGNAIVHKSDGAGRRSAVSLAGVSRL